MTTENKVELGAVQPPVKAQKKLGRPPKSKAQRIRELSKAGFTPKQIADKLSISAQQVYVVRHMDKKRQQELASKQKWAKPKPLPMPAESFPPVPIKAEGAKIPYIPYGPISTPPKPTFWQRVKAVFFPN